jgi:hypothetical protein
MIIYEIVDNITGNSYVGKTVKTVEKRFKEHLRLLSRKQHHNPRLQRIYNKNPSRLEIRPLEVAIQDCATLNEREVYWIAQRGVLNVTRGGDGGDTMTNNPNRVEIIRKLKNQPRLRGEESPNYRHLTRDQKLAIRKAWNSIQVPTLKEVAVITSISTYLCKRVLVEANLYIDNNRVESRKRLYELGLAKGSRNPNFTEDEIHFIKKRYVEDWQSCIAIAKELGLKSESATLRVIKEAGLQRSASEWTTYTNLRNSKKKIMS